jgi:hypothetical protein
MDARRTKSAQAHALRARIVLRSAEGLTNQSVAQELRVTPQVCKWRQRFIQRRVEGLLDEPRPGTPRTLGDAQVEKVIVRTLERMPVDATYWSVRSMASDTGLSPTSIHRIWKAFQLQPHRTETFKLSADPQFDEKVRDIVGPYLNPPEKALVLCVDEKSQIQALDRTQPLLPLRPAVQSCACRSCRRSGALPGSWAQRNRCCRGTCGTRSSDDVHGTPERRTHDYQRHIGASARAS